MQCCLDHWASVTYLSICHRPLLFVDGTGPLQALGGTVNRLQTRDWAEGTRKTYRVQLNCYMEFCKKVNVDPVPVSSYIISLYIAYMADVKRYMFCTIQNY